MNLQLQMEVLRGRQAAEWYEVNRSGEASDEERHEFAGWIAESPLNSAAYLKIVALSRETRAAAREAGLDGLALLRELNPKVLPFSDWKPEQATNSVQGKPPRRWRITFAVAATALLTIAGFVASSMLSSTRYSTQAAEERNITLQDGSTIYLNAKSNVRVRMTARARDIDLEGEAFFQVAHDSTRPFKVHTAEAVVRAVGTAFNVSTRSDGTRVAVTEGKVQLGHETSSTPLSTPLSGPVDAPQPIALKAGEVARVSPSGTIERRPASEAVNALAWREHLVVIDGMSLEEAVEEFNKYQRSTKLRLEGVAPGAHHYSGTFYSQDPSSFVEFLSRERDLTVEKGGSEIVIRERK